LPFRELCDEKKQDKGIQDEKNINVQYDFGGCDCGIRVLFDVQIRSKQRREMSCLWHDEQDELPSMRHGQGAM